MIKVMPGQQDGPVHHPLTPSTLLDMESQKCELRCTIFSVNGDTYKGEWLDNKKHGRGTQVWKAPGAMYYGEWKFGKRDGYGILSVLLPDTNTYAKKYYGGWKAGKKHGYGTFFYNNSAVYEGEWSEGRQSGLGRMSYENGDIYKGEWMNGQPHGQGTILFANGNWYEGDLQNGKRNGNGNLYYADKGQLYEGLWVDGVAKCGTLSDFGRNEVPTPTKYPIPQLHLADMHLVLSEAQSTHLERMLQGSTH